MKKPGTTLALRRRDGYQLRAWVTTDDGGEAVIVQLVHGGSMLAQGVSTVCSLRLQGLPSFPDLVGDASRFRIYTSELNEVLAWLDAIGTTALRKAARLPCANRWDDLGRDWPETVAARVLARKQSEARVQERYEHESR